MLWKTLIFLTAITVVLAGRIKKHQTSYEFHIKHDYHKKHDKHYDKVEEKKEPENEEKQQVEEEADQKESEQEEQVQQEDNKEEKPREQQNEGEISNTESHKPEHYEKSEYPAYEFLYKVEDHHTHDIKGHHEKKYGDEIKGAYWLLQPDGYKRIVKYETNKHDGFHADVEYSKLEKHNDKESNDAEQDEKKDEEHHAPKSEFYVTIYHGLGKPTPITEDVNEEQEQDKQQESAQHIPIYVA